MSNNKYKILVIEDEVNHPGWIKINPFYTAYITESNGKIIGRAISEFKIGNEYKMNPIFFDENGVAGPIYISKYLAGKNKDGSLNINSGIAPVAQSPVNWHTQLQDMNATDPLYRYTVETIWTRQLLQDLILIEFADSSCANFFPGNPNITTTGTTDSINYHTAINAKYGSVAEAPDGLVWIRPY